MTKLINLARTWYKNRSNKARLVSLGASSNIPGHIEKRAHGGQIIVGSECLIQGHLIVERNESQLRIENNVLVGGGTVIDCAISIHIESDVLVSYNCIISDSDNHSIAPELRRDDLRNWMNGHNHDWSFSVMKPVRICEGAWIGARSIILKGVTIGAGSVVGMGSVVTRDVPPRTVVAGNPARVIRRIPFLD